MHGSLELTDAHYYILLMVRTRDVTLNLVAATLKFTMTAC